MQNKNIGTSYRQELRGRIVKTAEELFARNGIKSVKMDDIANVLSISKRTLYEIYNNKEDLLLAVVKNHESEMHERMEAFCKSAVSVMDIIIDFYRLQLEELSAINPQFFEDLHKYPKLILHHDATRDKRKEQAAEFLERGVEEGYFRSNVNFSIVQNLAYASTQYVMNSYMYREYSLKELFENLLMLFIRGISTAKGIKVLDEFMEKELQMV